MSAFLFSSDAEIHRIGERLAARTLPKAEWTHAAHFAAALWLIRCRPELDAANVMPGMIRAYNEATGGINSDTAGYHETITQASLRAARAHHDRFALESPIFVVANALLASPLGDKEWPLAYWSRVLLFSVEARRAWVAPDLQELPF